MELVSKFISVALAAVFIQNAVFERAFGIDVAIYASRRKRHIIGIGFGITYISTLSSFLIYFIDKANEDNKHFYIFMPFIYILIISVIYILSLLLLWKYGPKLFKELKKYIHLSVFNCAVIGALLLNSTRNDSLWDYIGYGFGSGIGFIFATYLIYIGKNKLNSENIPKPFRGLPIMLIYIGILSLALYAFIGYNTTIS